MKITDVKIYPYNGDNNFKGYASVTFDNCFMVTGIKIVNGSKGLFVSMPSRKNNKDEYTDICFPVTKEFREELTNVILNKYNEKVGTETSEMVGFMPIDDDEIPF